MDRISRSDEHVNADIQAAVDSLVARLRHDGYVNTELRVIHSPGAIFPGGFAYCVDLYELIEAVINNFRHRPRPLTVQHQLELLINHAGRSTPRLTSRWTPEAIAKLCGTVFGEGDDEPN